jgi:hypothetical protein
MAAAKYFSRYRSHELRNPVRSAHAGREQPACEVDHILHRLVAYPDPLTTNLTKWTFARDYSGPISFTRTRTVASRRVDSSVSGERRRRSAAARGTW